MVEVYAVLWEAQAQREQQLQNGTDLELQPLERRLPALLLHYTPTAARTHSGRAFWAAAIVPAVPAASADPASTVLADASSSPPP